MKLKFILLGLLLLVVATTLTSASAEKKQSLMATRYCEEWSSWMLEENGNGYERTRKCTEYQVDYSTIPPTVVATVTYEVQTLN